VTALETAVRVIVDLLARGEFATIDRMTGGRRLSANDMREAVEEYGRTLCGVGATWWDTVVVTPVTRARSGAGRQFHVAAPLWTAEEGLSDLSVEIELTEVGPEVFRPAILDLHVL